MSHTTGYHYRNPLQKSELRQPMDSSSLQGLEINKVVISRVKLIYPRNHTGKLGRTVIIGHSAFVFDNFLPTTEDKLKLLRNKSRSKHGGFRINISTLPRMSTSDSTKNEHHLPSVPHTLCRESLPELRPALPASGESNSVHTQQPCFCYSLQLVSK